jgi:hypothetical protein
MASPSALASVNTGITYDVRLILGRWWSAVAVNIRIADGVCPILGGWWVAAAATASSIVLLLLPLCVLTALVQWAGAYLPLLHHTLLLT